MKTIDEAISTQHFKNIYLLYGPEDYLKRQYRDKLISALGSAEDTMNFARYEGDGFSVGEVIDLAETMPFFSDRRLILITDSGLFKKSSEELADYLGQVQETTFFIFVESEVDKRCKTYKAAAKAGSAVEFTMPGEKMIAAWMGKRLKEAKKTISREAWNEFLSRTNDSMENMDKEMEKLITYVWDKEGISLEDVCAVCVPQVQTKVFDMIAGIAARDLRRVLDLYHDMLSAKEPPMRILFLIEKQFRQMILIKDLAAQGVGQTTIAGRVGMPDFAVRKNLSLSRNFRIEQMQQLLSDAANFEEQVKTGKLDERMAVELLMIKYAKKSPA